MSQSENAPLKNRPLEKTSSRKFYILLAVVLFVGAVMRFWNFGVVSREALLVEPDTRDKVKLAEKTAFKEKSPEYYKHPRLLINTSALLLKAGALLGHKGRLTSVRIMVAYMMLLSLATAVVLYFIGLAAFKNRWVALMGAWLFTMAPASIVGTHYVKEDIPLMFGCSLAILFMLKMARQKKPIHYLAAGLFIGVAVGIKLTAAVLLVPYLAAHTVAAANSGAWKKALASPWVLAVLILLPVGFFLFNHQNLFNFTEFLTRTVSQMNYARTGHWDKTIFSPWDYWWSFQLRYGLFPGMTIAVSLAGIAGAALCVAAWRKNPTALVLTIWTVVFYLSVESSSAKPFPWFVRYEFPMIPGLACLAAHALFRLAESTARFRFLKAAGIAVATIVLIWPAAQSGVILSGLHPDTRVRAAQWAQKNLPAGAKLTVDSWFYSPRFSKRFEKVRHKFCQGKKSSRIEDEDYIVTNSINYERYFLNEHLVKESRIRADCFRRLLQECDVVKRFEPQFEAQTIGFHNPVITFLDRNSCKSEPGERRDLE